MKEMIKRILNKICCLHDWEVSRDYRWDGEWGTTFKTTYICKKCGKIKTMKHKSGLI